ncbi:MAG: hypothetical protein NT123_25750, partial [Proteobacteria bacterium]|nr:hypothetical protein [Pseudomonadota bacterium]
MPRLKSIAGVAALTVLTAFGAQPARADADRILAAIDAANASCRSVSQKIWEFKEPGQQEFKSAE